MLKSYLSSLPDEDARRTFAQACGTTIGHMRNCIYGRGRHLSPGTCVLVERQSGNAVRRWHLRPDWREIWPELENAPEAPRGPILDGFNQTVLVESEKNGSQDQKIDDAGQSAPAAPVVRKRGRPPGSRTSSAAGLGCPLCQFFHKVCAAACSYDQCRGTRARAK